MTTQSINTAMRIIPRVLILTLIGLLWSGTAWSSAPPINPVGTAQAQLNPAQRNSTQTAFDCSAVSEIPQIECEALVAIYNGTGGPDWTVSTDWLQTTTPCSWYGVMCGGGRVIELILDNSPNGNNLTGALPATIGDLDGLTNLALSSNQLSSIPTEIGNLSNLTSLDLYIGLWIKPKSLAHWRRCKIKNKLERGISNSLIW
ncbi:MAG: hypothetical protein AAF639_47550, partial [Chloroflexota bacterium]